MRLDVAPFARRVADERHRLPRAHRRPDRELRPFQQMPVEREKAVRVAEHQIVRRGAVRPIGREDRAIADRQHRRPARRGEIDPEVDPLPRPVGTLARFW